MTNGYSTMSNQDPGLVLLRLVALLVFVLWLLYIYTFRNSP